LAGKALDHSHGAMLKGPQHLGHMVALARRLTHGIRLTVLQGSLNAHPVEDRPRANEGAAPLRVMVAKDGQWPSGLGLG